MQIVTVQTDQTYIGPARDLVETGEARSGIPLSETLRQALALAIARAFRRPVDPDRLTWRLALAREKGAQRDALQVAEDCLISLGLYPERVRRAGSIPAYVGVGQAAYRAAGHLEPAYGFHHNSRETSYFSAGRDSDNRSDGALRLDRPHLSA